MGRILAHFTFVAAVTDMPLDAGLSLADHDLGVVFAELHHDS
jgi:hypothetical protein